MNPSFFQLRGRSVLAWPAGLRALAATLPLALLWLGVWWACLEAAPL
ncbi:MAG: hypothetical protein ACT4NV_10175 [Rhodoferax sp.]